MLRSHGELLTLLSSENSLKPSPEMYDDNRIGSTWKYHRSITSTQSFYSRHIQRSMSR